MQTAGTIPGYFVLVDTIQEKQSVVPGAEMNHVEINVKASLYNRFPFKCFHLSNENVL